MGDSGRPRTIWRSTWRLLERADPAPRSCTGRPARADADMAIAQGWMLQRTSLVPGNPEELGDNATAREEDRAMAGSHMYERRRGPGRSGTRSTGDLCIPPWDRTGSLIRTGSRRGSAISLAAGPPFDAYRTGDEPRRVRSGGDPAVRKECESPKSCQLMPGSCPHSGAGSVGRHLEFKSRTLSPGSEGTHPWRNSNLAATCYAGCGRIAALRAVLFHARHTGPETFRR